MEAYVESSKTDQYQDEARVVIARTGSETCPVKMMERYIEKPILHLTGRKVCFVSWLHQKQV